MIAFSRNWQITPNNAINQGEYRVSETSLVLPQISVTTMMALIEENRPLG